MLRKIIFRSYSNREIDCDADLYAQDRNENLRTTVVEMNDCKISFYILIDDGSNFPLKAKNVSSNFRFIPLHAHYKLTFDS